MSLLLLLPLGKEGEKRKVESGQVQGQGGGRHGGLSVSYILKQPCEAAAVIVSEAQIPAPLPIWANVIT